jgi:hypothetical protein
MRQSPRPHSADATSLLPARSRHPAKRTLAALALSLALAGCPDQNPCPPCYIDYSSALNSTLYFKISNEYDPKTYTVAAVRITLEDEQGKSELHKLDIGKLKLDGKLNSYVMPELNLVGDEAGGEGLRPTKAWIEIDFKHEGKLVSARSDLPLAPPS